ncbi:hypothetical protein BASA81_015589 [Batrachochytrium salamandrivorans]|nr:hypothetical protein BASA81_015589 [Batrachochytrium salamandrivorans]
MDNNKKDGEDENEARRGEEEPEEEGSTVWDLNARICLWIFITFALFLACAVFALCGVVLQLAPFRQIVAVYLLGMMWFAFACLVLPLIFACCYSTERLDYTPERVRLLKGDGGNGRQPLSKWRDRSEVRYCGVIAVLSLVVTVVAVNSLRFILPEVFFHSTTDLEIIRVTNVGPTHALLFVRSPSNLSVLIEVWENNTATSTLPVATVETKTYPELDYTAYVNVTHLQANTTYRFLVNSKWIGRFTTQVPRGAKARFSFYFGSSFMANFPDLGLGNHGWEHLATVLQSRPASSFVLFLGDFIFADHPWFLGNSFFDYASHYRQALSALGCDQVLSNFASYFMFAPHELFDDGANTSTSYSAWGAYLGVGNPGNLTDFKYHYTFEHGDVAFFVLDVRSRRQWRPYNGTMLGREQLDNLLSWLLAHRNSSTFKFIVSTVPWTAALDEGGDSWETFRKERNAILQHIQRHHIPGCVFLSSNKQMMFSKAELWFQGSGLWEFSSSVLGSYTTRWGYPWRRQAGNETSATFWYPLQSAFASTQVVVDVDTTAEPLCTFSFYDQGQLVHRDSLGVTFPGTRTPTPSPVMTPTTFDEAKPDVDFDEYGDLEELDTNLATNDDEDNDDQFYPPVTVDRNDTDDNHTTTL